jgi:hypothetical protein
MYKFLLTCLVLTWTCLLSGKQQLHFHWIIWNIILSDDNVCCF